jgi:hypothetical protein
MTLTNDELRELTGKSWRSRQVAWLEAHGVPFRLDGKRVLVAKSAAEAYLRGERMTQTRRPDFSGAW